ncbi:KpsF/GutQ family sugar-phosphate isomerase [Nitratidesulfovibrio vulgaris]|uniref:KpsF/GutQ family protein n=1 Tax=Nitratidesulfovibrio vulgaris (strain DP4) TaxID=391774 RepID=A0A0H3AB80_NITV4|nr:KpsF/GutQ family sugar-phosphate isomerase [Nitratidesulfovibrio vulgaris]ABM29595.1 KpsF/GutQ family protein [Nitratidesulfovibrio vulgaris DP4]
MYVCCPDGHPVRRAQLTSRANDKNIPKINFAASVLQQEAHALTLLARGLDTSFCDAVDCLYGISGRIAVTGMGKSGHVGRKVAATLASTGSPAYFIHPSEASHGDLGMLVSNDAVLAFSNSGNTAELSDIILYSARRGIPLIGVTRNSDSLLGKHSTHLLLLPLVPEADPLGCAPTTSTTLQMALGDALALTLMCHRGCSPEEFHRWHPGGSLGRKLLTVKEIMHSGAEVPLISSSTPMPEVLCLMTGKGFGVAGILEKDRLVGIITDGDLRRHMGITLMDKTARQVMHPDPVVVDEGTLAVAALRLMQKNQITSLFVTRKGEPVGILNVHDCLRAGVE